MAANGKEKEGGGAGGKGGKRSPGTTSVSMPCVLKFLAPEALAAAIIGKGGTVIAAMRQSCQAKIALTEQGEVYPQTDCRVMTVQAETEQSLNDVSRQVISKLAELAKGAAAKGVGNAGELKLRTLVPRAAVGAIVGKGGASIKQMRETSGAKINIGDTTGQSPGSEQVVSAAGTEQALESVVTEVNRQIQLVSGEPWFQNWASSTGVVPALTGGYPGNGQSMNMMNMRGSPGVDVMMRVANSLPPYVMEDSRGFALSCVVPNRLVGALIGRGGAGTKEVQNLTGTRIGIREIPDDADNRSLNIAGPLANTCAAYMLMMKRYLDAEAASPSGSQQPPR